jgi:hypothetical protein
VKREMRMKVFRAYGKDKKTQRWGYIAKVRGRSKASALRTFKKMSGWPYTKLR